MVGVRSPQRPLWRTHAPAWPVACHQAAPWRRRANRNPCHSISATTPLLAPPRVGKLENLEVLTLGGNDAIGVSPHGEPTTGLMGEIPREIANLRRLKELDLQVRGQMRNVTRGRGGHTRPTWEN